MLNINNIFNVKVSSSYEQWWRYNLYMTVAGYDGDGKMVTYRSATDKVYDIASATGERTAPPKGYKKERAILVESEPCKSIEVYFYAIANTFPESAAIKDSPPFKIDLTVTVGGRIIEQSDYEVNQWGGITIAGLKINSNE